MTRRPAVVAVALGALLWSGSAVAGPVEAITNWLREQVQSIWDAFVAFMQDLFVLWLEHTLNLISFVVHQLPAPDFLTDVTLCGVLSSAGPWAQWAIGTFRLGEALALLAAGLVFRLLRIFLTLFQWT